MEAGGGHLFDAEVVPEAKVRSQQKIMPVQVIKRHGRIFREGMLRWHLQRGVVVIPKSTHKERMQENFEVFDFSLSAEDMEKIAVLDKAQSSFFSHQDPATVEWFAGIVEQRRQKDHDPTKEKKIW